MVAASLPIHNREAGKTEDAPGAVKERPVFGKALRRKDFLFDDDYLNLNHGSFGTYPRIIRDVLRAFQDRAEARPDQFIRYDYPKALDESRAAMARFLNVPAETVTFVPNATTGVNTVLRNLVFSPGDVIVYFATVYGACEKTITYITETTPAEAVRVGYTYPLTDSALVSAFEDAVQGQKAAGKRPVLALFDTVASMPGVRMPFAALTASCRALGLLSCIDGAHGVGHIDLDLGALDPDFFVSNCHKWLLVPRGCAVFYAPLRNQPLLRSTLPTSHGFEPRARPGAPAPPASPLPPSTKSAYVTNFEFVGTIDASPYLCVPAALRYRAETLGGEAAIRDYCETLARKAGERTAAILGTEILENEQGTLGNCFFANVRLPISRGRLVELVGGEEKFEAGGHAILVRDWVTARLMHESGIFFALLYYAGAWWVRLSATVYLDIEDFEHGAKLLKACCEQAEAGKYLDKEPDK